LVLKYTIAGTTGDTTAGTLIDASVLIPAVGVSDLKLMGAQWGLTGCSINILWNATTNVPIIECTAGEGSQDFSKFGGISNNAGTGVNGDVLFTSTGYTASGDGGHIYLWFKKK
jgi:hypothetical protein